MKFLIIAILLATATFAGDSFVKKYTKQASCPNELDTCRISDNTFVVVFNYNNTADVFVAKGFTNEARFFNLGKTDSSFKTKDGTVTQIIKAVDDEGRFLTIQYADDPSTKSSFLRLFYPKWGYLELFGDK